MSRELPLFVQIAGPSLLIQVACFIVWVVNSAWVGRSCGETAMGGVSLGNLAGNLSATSMLFGLLSALDTLAPQEMGAGRHREVGVLAQRGFALAMLAFVPCVVLWWYIEDVLVWAGQPLAASALAARFLRGFSAAVPPLVGFECVRRFLSAQGIVAPIARLTLPITLLHPALLWLWVGTDCAGGNEELAVQNVALATACTQALYLSAALLYVAWVRPHRHGTWTGWHWREAICGVGEEQQQRHNNPVLLFLRLGLPGILASSEWWFWEGVCFMAGALGTTSLAAHTVAYNVIPLCFMFSMGLGIGLATRIGTLLGEGSASVQLARQLTFRFMLLGCALASTIALAVFVGRDLIVELFVGDNTGADGAALRDGVRRIWPAVTIFVALDGLFALCFGVIRGLGLQARQSWAVLLSLWAVGLPCMHHAAFGGASVNAGATDSSPERLARLQALWSWMPWTYVLANAFLILAFCSVSWDRISCEIVARGSNAGSGNGSDSERVGTDGSDGGTCIDAAEHSMTLSLRVGASSEGRSEGML